MVETLGEAVENCSGTAELKHSYTNTGGKDQSEDEVAMVLALQPSVSRRKDCIKGAGLPDMLSSVSWISAPQSNGKTEVRLMSGRAAVSIPVKFMPSRWDSDEMRHCWINEACVPHDAPEKDRLAPLEGRYPGTVLEICVDICPHELHKRKKTASQIRILDTFRSKPADIGVTV